ncbi:unnamed protein product [Allacma fusca]|uniref:Peptidase S1 domain-containing protein n=1 Tax=Allacma fusca TaxID=39272 RepID=A0A8J2PEN4_9HEXA|nr:unnamed protein product [Allacma fusca]
MVLFLLSFLMLVPSMLCLPEDSDNALEIKEELPSQLINTSFLEERPLPAKKQISITTSLFYFAGLGSRPVVDKPCRCGIRNTTGNFRIYNGERARVSEFPWRVSINPVRNTAVSICSGALIAKDTVLTSASCVHEKSIEHMLIDLGDHNLAEDRETTNVLVSIIEKIVHENFDPQKDGSTKFPNNPLEDFDIALLILAEPIEAENIMPVCLPRKFTSQDLSGTQVITSGWGSNGTMPSRTLNKVQLSYFTSEQFRKEIGPNNFPSVKIPENDNLVYTFDKNKGIYPTDFGTTMEHVNLEDGRYYAVGVADAIQVLEAADGSKRILGAWTDVTKFVDWIDENIPNAKSCNL